MPALMPTVEDLRRMNHRQRDKAVKAIRAVMDETDRFIDEVMEGRSLSPEQRAQARRALWSVAVVGDTPDDGPGYEVRDRARHLERSLRTDPPWVIAARRQALLEAIQ